MRKAACEELRRISPAILHLLKSLYGLRFATIRSFGEVIWSQNANLNRNDKNRKKV